MRSLPRFTLILLLSSSLVTGCGGLLGDGDSDAGSAGQSGDSGGDAPLPEEQVVTVGQTFWHSGFQVEIGDATLSAAEDAFGEPVVSLTLAATFTNLGESQSYFGAQVAVVSGATSYPIGFDSEVPDVPGGLAGEGTLIFPVEPGFDLATAQLVVGGAEENQAQVPIGPQGGDLVDLAPREVPMSGELTLELLDFTFTTGEIRADRVESYSEVEQGSRALTMTFTATSRKGGNWSIHASDFALIVPSGNAVAADAASLGSLSGNDSGVDTEGLSVRFIIPDPTDGDYTLRFTAPNYWLGEDADRTEGTYEFSL